MITACSIDGRPSSYTVEYFLRARIRYSMGRRLTKEKRFAVGNQDVPSVLHLQSWKSAWEPKSIIICASWTVTIIKFQSQNNNLSVPRSKDYGTHTAGISYYGSAMLPLHSTSRSLSSIILACENSTRALQLQWCFAHCTLFTISPGKQQLPLIAFMLWLRVNTRIFCLWDPRCTRRICWLIDRNHSFRPRELKSCCFS